MHDFFANARFTLAPASIPLPDGESTPPMESVMRSFGEAEIVPFAPAPRNLRSRPLRPRQRRRPSSVLPLPFSVL